MNVLFSEEEDVSDFWQLNRSPSGDQDLSGLWTEYLEAGKPHSLAKGCGFMHWPFQLVFGSGSTFEKDTLHISFVPDYSCSFNCPGSSTEKRREGEEKQHP